MLAHYNLFRLLADRNLLIINNHTYQKDQPRQCVGYLSRMLQKKLKFYTLYIPVNNLTNCWNKMQEEQTYSKVSLWQMVFFYEILWNGKLEILLLKKGTNRKCKPVERLTYATEYVSSKNTFSILKFTKNNAQSQ